MFVTYVLVCISMGVELLVRDFYFGIKSAVSTVQDKGCSLIWGRIKTFTACVLYCTSKIHTLLP